ncbi:MAG: polysaccharide deacetylase family protein [Bacteroidales bacterium]|nr:polysaccharide deacetylase family protein [Bacteroidales bacterium]MBN2757721.1 polysaccharide deacetylase family protein [Bacteroidales bacterium]
MEFLQINKLKGKRFPLKSYISKLSFELARNPKIEKNKNWQKYIPKPYKAVLLISADFELAWAFRFTKSEKNPVENALKKAQLARKNIPGILSVCKRFNVPITWATVGHLFLNSCEKENGIAHNNLKRLDYFESPYWKFDKGDWFDADPCSNIEKDPEWYAPDLISNIKNSNVNHEIGCHTFSHIDCRESVCSPDVFKSELNECRNIAEKNDVDLKSFVFPGHTLGNIDYLKDLGFSSYRSNYVNTLAQPFKRKDGLWEHKSTVEFDIRENWSNKYHIYRYKKIIDRAIKNHTSCHFWFHPSFSNKFLVEIMPSIFEYIDKKRDEIWVTTMHEYTKWLNENI